MLTEIRAAFRINSDEMSFINDLKQRMIDVHEEGYERGKAEVQGTLKEVVQNYETTIAKHRALELQNQKTIKKLKRKQLYNEDSNDSWSSLDSS